MFIIAILFYYSGALYFRALATGENRKYLGFMREFKKADINTLPAQVPFPIHYYIPQKEQEAVMSILEQRKRVIRNIWALFSFGVFIAVLIETGILSQYF